MKESITLPLYIHPCVLDPKRRLHPPPPDLPLRIRIQGPLVAIQRLLPNYPWDKIGAFPQPGGIALTKLTHEALYGPVSSDNMGHEVRVRDEYLAWVMENRRPSNCIDYYGVTLDHRVPPDDPDPEVLVINIIELEAEAGDYADGQLYADQVLAFPVHKSDYAGKKVLAVPRCCQIKKGTLDRRLINEQVVERDERIAKDMDRKKATLAASKHATEVDISADRFLLAATRRQKILDTINATQHAAAALYQTRQDLFALGDEQGDLATMAEKMREAAEREKKEWMKLKGSKLRKLFHPAAYAAELKKEEDDYYEAYEWQLRAEASAKEMGKQTVALRKKKDELLKQVEEHREAQVQLMDLYEELFDGPTPNYPEEDEMEANYDALQEALDTIQGKITHTYNVCQVLGPARSALNAALDLARTSYDTALSNLGGMTANLVGDMVQPEHTRPVSDARLRLSTYDATGGTLERIRRLLASADQSMAAAQRLDPAVMAHVLPQIDPDNRARHTGRVDRLLNAPLTDIIFYQEIAEAGEALETVARVVAEEADGWDLRLEGLREERTPVEAELRRCREELYELRARLFDDATNPPPQYTDGTREDQKDTTDKGEE